MKKTLILSSILVSIIVCIICLGIGSIHIDPIVTYKIMLNKYLNANFNVNWADTFEVIILQIRLPRIILGFLTGASMAMIGVLMQTLTKNYLAEPFILGISSGASAGAVSVIILSTTVPFFSYFTVSEGAFIGALLSTIIVFSINFNKYALNALNLVLVGVGVSSFFSALTSFIIYSSTNNSQIITAMFWMTGSLSSATMNVLTLPLVVSVLSLVVILIFAYELDIFLLGDSVSRSLGINIVALKLGIILISTLVVSSIVSLTGIIGFVGLIIPHIARKLIGHKHCYLVPFSFFLGGIFLILADTFARSVFAPEEIPIGVVTAFIGAPIFLWIIKKNYVMGGNK